MRSVRLLFTLSFVFCCWLSSFSQCLLRDSTTYQSLGSGRYHFTAHATGGTHIAYVWFDQGNFPLAYTGDSFTLTFPPGQQGVISQVFDSATGCYAVDTVLFTVPCSVFTTHIVDTALGGARYQRAEVSGGNGTYSYTWSDTVYNSAYVNVTFHSGTNCVTVTDAYSGCTASACQNTCNIQVTSRDSFSAGTNSLIATPSGGVPPYTYYWNTNSSGYYVTATYGTPYVVTITDALGCSVTDSLSLQACSFTATARDSAVFAENYLVAYPTSGTAPYSYYWNGSNTNTGYIYYTPASGTYPVRIVDSRGCTSYDTVVIVPCHITATYYDSVDVSAPFDVTINMRPTSGTPPYTYQWSTGSSGYFVNAYRNQVYRVTITDIAGCTVVDTVSLPACNVITDSISLVSLGSGTYGFTAHQAGAARPAYQWYLAGWVSLNAFHDTITHTFAAGPQYIVVRVTDSATGCIGDDTLSFTVPVASCSMSVSIRDTFDYYSGQPVFQSYVTDSINSTFTYSWSDGSTGNKVYLPYLPHVSYCLTVTDRLGCTATACDTTCIFYSTVHDSLTSTADYFTATVSGTAPYQYYWDYTLSSSNSYSILSSTNQSFVPLLIIDSRGCYSEDTMFTNFPCSLTTTLTSTHTVSNRYTFAATPASGTAPFTYSWTIDGYALPFTTATVTDSLPAGNYTVCVHITDYNGCTASQCDTFTVGSPVNCNLSVVVADTLYGVSIHSKYAQVTDANNHVFTYHWNTPSGGTSDTLYGLYGISAYCVTVTDGLGCVASSCDTTCTLSGHASYTVSGPGWNQSATPISGIAPYHYLWSSGDTTATFYTTVHGVYYVTITDAHGCTHVSQDTLGTPCYMVGSLYLNNYSATAQIYISIYNSTGTVTYQWSGGSYNGNSDTIYASGTYCVTATDASGCSVSLCDTVHLGCALQLSLYDSASVGYHTLLVNSLTGGHAPYTYGWSDNSHAPTLVQHVNGTYCLTVTDAYGCTASACDTIHMPCTLRAHVVDSDFGTYHILYARPDSGATPYSYTWTDISNNTWSTAPYYYINQSRGYCLNVTDTNGCYAGYCDSVIIGCNISASYTYTHTTGNSYTFTTTSTGGVAPLRYNWGVDNQNAVLTTVPSYTITLTQGTHTVCVNTYDANGCFDSICQSVIVAAPGCNINASYTYTHTASNTYTFTTTSTGGTAPLRYNWGVDNQLAVLTTVPSYTITLTQGTHTVCVKTYDANNCADSVCQTVVVPAPVVCNMTAYINTYNNITSQILVAHELNSHGTVHILWSNNATTAAITASTSGSYCVTITDSLGCTATACDTVHLIQFPDTICGFIFNDRNVNGIADPGEPGIPGQSVMIYQGNNYVETINADTSGYYRGAVPAGPITITYWSPGIDAVTVPLGREANMGIVSYDSVTITGAQCGFNFGVVDSGITISGYVYFDLNGNGVQDAGEAGVPNQIVFVGPHIVYTDQSGFYVYTGDPGLYTVTYSQFPLYSGYTVYPTSHTVSAGTSGGVYANNNFGLSSNTTACNISVLMIAHTTVTAGYPAWYDVYVENHGNNVATGTVTFYYDPALAFNYANPSQASLNTTNHYVTFNYSNLQPGNYKVIDLSFNALSTVTVGQSTFEMATATDNCIESNFADNTDTLHQTATGSWDPNSKVVTPSGDGPQGLIHRDQQLRYTINFQNTGTSPAVNIVLKDSIPASLDVSTLEILGASHPHYAIHVEGHMLTCQFSRIMLPDSSADEQGSHGYLAFAIKPNATIADGTQIQNTAAIYFDYNEAVVTNTTLNTIDYTLSVADLQNHATITVSPNPFSDYTTIRVTGEDMHGASLDVYNDLGQVVTTSTPTTDGVFTISRGGLSSGIYTYHISHAGSLIGSGKLVVE